MRKLPFKSSSALSVGVELEFQLVNPATFDLVSRAKELMHDITQSSFKEIIKPEVTQSMIEINSTKHKSVSELVSEFEELRFFLLDLGARHNVHIAGGGTHAFGRWSAQKIFPTERYKRLSKIYGFLSKQTTVFGQHVHIGCPSAEDALYITHALGRYVPHFIALAASSPFFQGADSGFQSSRLTTFNAFPQSGVIPYLEDWAAFSAYFYKMRRMGVIDTMKDFYWDVRPKPEFGTVEVRVCDTPLTMQKAILIASYMQTLVHYLLDNKPQILCRDLYYLYNFNRFQACRFGYDGDFFDAESLTRLSLKDDMLNTLKLIASYAADLNNTNYLAVLQNEIQQNTNDAALLRSIYHRTGSLPAMVSEQCHIWANNSVSDL
jgi:carboxylate-amine ligase